MHDTKYHKSGAATDIAQNGIKSEGKWLHHFTSMARYMLSSKSIDKIRRDEAET